ncbi:MAG: peptidylprolyl isomerase [Candidatus Methanomethylophilaceae archaeon]|nr:peptidylprolyl isomerase [Candidatus Methanomethylophilaceae archaeon]
MTTVILHTNVGDIRLKMYDDMPITAGNFVELAKKGFYDGVIFHRVIEGFMIQGGDPTGTGMGGPGYNIQDEFVKGHSNVRGTISMANTGRPNTGGSQFFINTADNKYLDWDDMRTPSKHPVFGECEDEESYKVVLTIERTETDYNDRPVDEKRIIKAEVIE